MYPVFVVRFLGTQIEPSPNDCPRAQFACLENVPRTPGTSNKSLDTYSLTATGSGRQRVAPNGQNRGSNGPLGQPTVIFWPRKRGYSYREAPANLHLRGRFLLNSREGFPPR